MTGRGREIRTPDILLPKQARYQTALYPELAQLHDKHREIVFANGVEYYPQAVLPSIIIDMFVHNPDDHALSLSTGCCVNRVLALLDYAAFFHSPNAQRLSATGLITL